MLRLSLKLDPGKKAYFASDFHLGAPNATESLAREKKLVTWLNHISADCQYLFLVGDIFDFWFEYKHVVPKGFVRFLGKLAELSDRGVQIFVFSGNHDMWMFGYLEEQLGATVYREPVELDWSLVTMLVGHGDGLGPGDYSYKFLKKVFRNPLCQFLFGFLHPGIGIGIAKAWSGHSRIANNADKDFLGEKEFLWVYCQEQERIKHRDFYIFGHRHLPLDLTVGEHSRYLNLGEWLNHFKYIAFDGQYLEMKTWANHPE